MHSGRLSVLGWLWRCRCWRLFDWSSWCRCWRLLGGMSVSELPVRHGSARETKSYRSNCSEVEELSFRIIICRCKMKSLNGSLSRCSRSRIVFPSVSKYRFDKKKDKKSDLKLGQSFQSFLLPRYHISPLPCKSSGMTLGSQHRGMFDISLDPQHVPQTVSGLTSIEIPLSNPIQHRIWLAGRSLYPHG